MNITSLLPSIVGLLLFAVAFWFLRRRARAGTPGSVEPGLLALRTHFATSRQPGETEPICVVGFHRRPLSLSQVTLGVTDQRVLVFKDGAFHAFPYDAEGEHLPEAQKNAQGRGFFRWRCDKAQTHYCPQVKNFPPFAGQEWLLYPTVAGFPEQLENLRQYSRLFYFMWFFD